MQSSLEIVSLLDIFYSLKFVQYSNQYCVRQSPARFSSLKNSREFFFIFTSCSRSRAILVKVKKVKAISILLFFSREKRVKSGAGYDLTSLYLPKLHFFKCEIFPNLNFTIRQFLQFQLVITNKHCQRHNGPRHCFYLSSYKAGKFSRKENSTLYWFQF